MKEEWQLAHKDGLKNEKEVLRAFIKRVKMGMKNEWDHKIKLNSSVTSPETEEKWTSFNFSINILDWSY